MSSSTPTRRQLLRAAMFTAAGASMPVWVRAAAIERNPNFLNDAFSLGVASGDPTPDGAVIWTRLAPLPLAPGGGVDPVPMEVRWEVAEDYKFRKILASGKTLARPESAHAVHIELRGLAPNRPVFYRFHSGAATSPTGRFTTAPAFGSQLDRMRIAWAGCQHYEQGYFTAYQDMVEQQPDLIIHTGDYIYESSWGPQIRRHAVPEALTLEDYRATHALYKLDPDLQAAHAAAPWLYIWDDHEVDNDYAGDISEKPDVDPKDFYQRRVAAYQAYFENQPLRRRSRLTSTGEMRIWGLNSYGNIANIFLTDGRQYRTPAACPTEHDRGGNLVPENCTDLTDKNRTYLGKTQERWLGGVFGRGPARWNLLVQPTLFSPFNGAKVDDEPAVWTDGWSGYPESRQRLTNLFAQRKNANPIVLGGDTHCYWVGDVKQDYGNENQKPVGAEFVTTSTTSLRGGYDAISSLLPQNPHIKHFDNREHGYGLLDLYHDRAEVDLRVIDTPLNRAGSKAHSQAKFIVEAGKPGIVT